VTSRTKNLTGLLAFALAGAVMVWFVRSTQRGRVRAIDAVPADAFLVVTLDLDLLRASPLGAPLLSGPGRSLLADKDIAATCGFDPLDRMREIAVAVPVEDDTGEFGIAIRADVGKDELVDCARKVVEARGGGDPVTIRQSGSFTLVEPADSASVVAKRYPTLAYREGGPFLIARGPWLGTMIDTAEGKLPSARRESRHLALRSELGQTSDDHPVLALVATVILPRPMRERIRREMGAEVAGQPGDRDSPALMAGVLGVESAGIGIRVGDAKGSDTEAVIELHCEDDAACAAVARIVDKQRRNWSGDLRARLLGVGPLLDNLTVETTKTTLRASTHAPSADAASWLGRVLELRSARHPAIDPDAGATTRPAPSSDETIKPVATSAPEAGRPAP
jgi:hypothetical protein